MFGRKSEPKEYQKNVSFALLFHVESQKDSQDFSAQPFAAEHRDYSMHHTEFCIHRRQK